MYRLIFILLAISSVFGKKLPPEVCGTHAAIDADERHQHERAMERRFGKTIAKSSYRAALASDLKALSNNDRDIGNIAIIEDSGGVVSTRNPFNLDRSTLTFTPVGTGYRFEKTGDSYDSAAATSGTPVSGLGDDDTRALDLPFTFPYYDKKYTRVFLNSDGNLTMDEGDGSSNDRSLGRLLSGLPRIAPLFSDLDPSRTNGGVRVLAAADRVVVSWVAVPIYSDAGGAPTQTFQVRLYPDGKIQFAWNGINSLEGVVGIAPGRLRFDTSVLTLTAGSTETFAGAIAERFSQTVEVDLAVAAQRFYQKHSDSYDYIVFFNALGVSAGDGALAFLSTVRNQKTGYGDRILDVGLDYGSPRRLQAVINFGPTSQYPSDPNRILPVRTLNDTTLTIMGHETGHLFLAYVSTREASNPAARPMLGRQLFHWAFTFNSDGSLLEGNRIEDLGAAANPRFRTGTVNNGYSAWDQYLMGFRAPQDVPPSFFVQNSGLSPTRYDPQPNVTFNGTRRDVAIDEIIGIEGPRVPDYTVAQRRFRMAIVLIASAGTTPAQSTLTNVENYRTQFEAAYARWTGNRAVLDTSLKQGVELSLAPAAGVLVGRTAPVTVALNPAPAEAMTLRVVADRGILRAPETVAVAAGATSATFNVEGLAAGVEELRVEPSLSSYEMANARVQVLGSAQELKASVLAGDQQKAQTGVTLADAIVFKVSDKNALPYPGVKVVASTASGTVSPSEGVTDRDGLVSFRWTPGSSGSPELKLSVDGGPSATAAALRAPSFTAAAVRNAASFEDGLAPGGIATIFGENLLGSTVRVGGVTAQTLFVSNNQVNFVVPDTTAVGQTAIVVTNVAGATAPVQVNIVRAAPGIFFNTANGVGAVIPRGSGVLEVYATGLGETQISNGLALTSLSVTAEVAGQRADVLYSGLAPGFIGLYQVNVQAPTALRGQQTLVLQADGRRSNTVTVRID